MSTEDRRLGVAMVGLGWWGRALTRVLEGNDKMHVVTGVDVDPTTEEFAREHKIGFTADYGAVLADDDIDAVILCTPHSQHTEQVVRAARAKKHVFCEKPLALNRRDAVASVEVCNANGVVLGIGHEFRCKPPIVDLTRMARAGELGTIMQGEVTFSMDNLVSLPANHWRRSEAEAPCGPLTSTGIHGLDLLVSVLGPAESVMTSMRRLRGAVVDDALAILIHFKSGADGVMTALTGPPFSTRFAVYGSRGWVEIRDRTHPETPEGWIVTRCMRGGKVETLESPPMSVTLANLEVFADAACGRAPLAMTQSEMIATISALEAIIKSAASGQIEPVEG